MNKQRLNAIDGIRGINFISMALFHAMYDIVYIFGSSGFEWFQGVWGEIWQQTIAWTFILLSGFSQRLGKSKWRRAIIVFGCGFAITVVTALFMPSELIVYGVLTFMGASMLLMIPLSRLLDKVNAVIGAVVSFLLFGFTRNISNGFLGFFEISLLEIPKALYETEGLAFFGFPTNSFHSADYFPLFPWFFLYLFGYFIAKPILSSDKAKKILSADWGIFSRIGKHTLPLYMLHQPLIYVLLSLIYAL